MARKNFTLDDETLKRLERLVPEFEHNSSLVVREALRLLEEIYFSDSGTVHLRGLAPFEVRDTTTVCAATGITLPYGSQAFELVWSNNERGPIVGPAARDWNVKDYSELWLRRKHRLQRSK